MKHQKLILSNYFRELLGTISMEELTRNLSISDKAKLILKELEK